MKKVLGVTLFVAIAIFLMEGCGGAPAAPAPAPAPAPAAPAPAAPAPAPAAPAPAAPAPVEQEAGHLLKGPEFVNEAARKLGVPLLLPQPPEVHATKYGGTITVASYRQNPWENLVVGWQQRLSSFMAEPLLYFDIGPGTDPANYNPTPLMAESWEAKDSGLTYVFHLQKGVKWASNSVTKVDETKDITAQDWVDMYKIVFGLEANRFIPRYPEIDGPESWRAIDDYTLEVKLSQPSAAFLYKLAAQGPALHNVNVMYDRAEKEGIPIEEALKGWEIHVGSGPWVIADWQQDVTNVYEKNPNYWLKDKQGNQLPFIDKVEFFMMPDERAQDAGFRTGKLAAAAIDTCGLSTERYLDINKSNPDTVWEIFVDPTNQRAMAPSYAEGSPFHDIRVRRAMQLSVDKEGWVNSVLGGWGLPYATPLAPGNQYWLPPGDYGDYDGDGIPGERYLDYDIEAAKQLMAEAGYSADNPIQARLLLTHDLGNRFFSEAELMAEAFRKIGIETTIEVKDGAARRSAEESGDFDMLYDFPGYGWDPSDWFLRGYHSLSTERQFGPAGLSDPVFDKMIEEEERQIDPAVRWEHVAELQRYAQEKQYYIMGTNWMQIVGIQPWLKNYQYHYISPIGQSFKIAWIDR